MTIRTQGIKVILNLDEVSAYMLLRLQHLLSMPDTRFPGDRLTCRLNDSTAGLMFNLQTHNEKNCDHSEVARILNEAGSDRNWYHGT